MNNLQLSLKKNWFEMTKDDIKPEDYREITPYWCNRFLLVYGKVKSKEWWENELNNIGYIFTNNYLFIDYYLDVGRFTFKKYDYNIMTLGYPSKDDTSRIIKLEHKGIEIRTGNPEWGAEPNKLYFVIKHGDIIK